MYSDPYQQNNPSANTPFSAGDMKFLYDTLQNLALYFASTNIENEL